MKTHQQVRKTASPQQTDMPTSASCLQSRPFAPITKPDVVEQQAASVQEKSDRANRFGDYWDRIDPTPRKREGVQPKLTLGRPGDKYEQEANRVAKQVVQRLNTLPSESATQKLSIQRQEMREEELQMQPYPLSIQRQDVPEADKQLQRSPIILRRISDGEMAVTNELEASIQQARGRGQPLLQRIQEPMEQAFGADFSGVRVHTDAQSDQLNQSIQARAFTTGQDVFFRQGAYEPESRSGQELIAHELTHVVQQNGERVQRQLEIKSSLGSRSDLAQPITVRHLGLQCDVVQRLYLDDPNKIPGELPKLKEHITNYNKEIDPGKKNQILELLKSKLPELKIEAVNKGLTKYNILFSRLENEVISALEQSKTTTTEKKLPPTTPPKTSDIKPPTTPPKTSDIKPPTTPPKTSDIKPPTPTPKTSDIKPPTPTPKTEIKQPTPTPKTEIKQPTPTPKTEEKANQPVVEPDPWKTATLMSDPSLLGEHKGKKTFILANKEFADVQSEKIGFVGMSFNSPVEVELKQQNVQHNWGIIKEGTNSFEMNGKTVTTTRRTQNNPRTVNIEGQNVKHNWGIIKEGTDYFEMNGKTVTTTCWTADNPRTVNIEGQNVQHNWGIIKKGTNYFEMNGKTVTTTSWIAGGSKTVKIEQENFVHNEQQGYIIIAPDNTRRWVPATGFENKSGLGNIIIAPDNTKHWVPATGFENKSGLGNIIIAPDNTRHWVPATGFENKSKLGSIVIYSNQKYWVPKEHSQEIEATFVSKSNELLFPSEGPQAKHVKQGHLGNCYLMAALASITEKDPGFPRDMMEDNGDTVTVRLFDVTKSSTSIYTEGEEAGEYAAKDFACTPKYIKIKKSVAQQAGEDLYAKEYLWVQMVEKAYASGGFKGNLLTPMKVEGSSYENIASGSSKFAFEVLLGQEARSTSLGTKKEKGKLKGVQLEGDIYQRIEQALKDGKAVGAGTRKLTTQEQVLAKKEGLGHSAGESKLGGIVAGHAYSVLEVKGNNQIKLRNPWGQYGRKLDGTIVEKGDGTVELYVKEFLDRFESLSISGKVERWRK